MSKAVRGRKNSIAERLRLDHFRFWREIGGKLPKAPPEPLRLGGLLHLISYIRYVKWSTLGLLITIFLSSYLSVLPAFVIKRIVNQDLKAHSSGSLVADIGELILLYVAVAIVGLINGWFSSYTNTRIVWHMREDVFRKQAAMPLQKFVGRGTGQTMVRTLNEVGVPGGDSTVFSGVAGILNTLTSAISYIVTIVSTVTAMFVLNVQLTLWSFLLLPIAIVLAVWWGKLSYGAAHRQYESLTSLANFLLKHTSKHHVLLEKLLRRRGHVAREFRSKNRVLTNASILERVLPNFYNNLFQIIQGATIGVLWLIGGHHVFSGTLTLGVILAMITLVTNLNNPLRTLAEVWFSIRTLTAVAERVSQDLEAGDDKPPVHNRESERPSSLPYTLSNASLVDVDGHILVSDMTLSLAAGDVLTVFDNQMLENGQWSWAAALAGWLPYQSGRLTIGGVKIDADDTTNSRSAISIVSSEVPVSELTLRKLWQSAAPTSEKRDWEQAWQAVIGDRAPFPNPDLRLTDDANSEITRFFASLVAARMRGSLVLVVVEEPELQHTLSWRDLGCAIIRIQPKGHRLIEGTRCLIRTKNGTVKNVIANQHNLKELEQLLPTKLPPVKDALSTSSPEALEGDGSGWWASLGLRRHATKETGRFFVPFSWLFGYIRKYWVYWLIILVCGEVIAGVVQTFQPLFSKTIIDAGIGKHNVGVLNYNSFLLIVFGVVQGIANACFVTLFIQTAGKRMCGEIREDFFTSIMRAPFKFFKHNEPSEIASRGINDINAIFNGTDQLIKVLTWQIIPNIPGMILLWTLGGLRFGLLTLLVDLPFVAFTVWVARFNSRIQERLFQVVGAMFAELGNMARLPRTILTRAFALEEQQAAVLGVHNRLIYKLGLVQSLRNTWYNTISILEGNLLTAVFYLVGGLAIIHGNLTMGVLIAIMTYAQLYVGLGGGVSSYVTIYGTLANVDRVANYMAPGTEAPIIDTPAQTVSNALFLNVRASRGTETRHLHLVPGTIQRITGSPKELVEIRDTILGLDAVDEIDLGVAEDNSCPVSHDDWRKSVMWLTGHFPFDNSSVNSLLEWMAATDQTLNDAKRFLKEYPGVTDFSLGAEEWTQGYQPELVIQLVGAMAIAHQSRLILVTASIEDEKVRGVIQELQLYLPNSTFLSLESEGVGEEEYWNALA